MMIRRKNSPERMTIVEQLAVIREDVCTYACKYKESVANEYKEKSAQRVALHQYCNNCPLTKLHYNGK